MLLTSSAFAAGVLVRPVRADDVTAKIETHVKDFELRGPCEYEQDSKEDTLQLPEDVAYRFISVTPVYVERDRDFSVNGYSYEWDAPHHRLNVKMWTKRNSSCWLLGWWHGDDTLVHVRLSVQVMRNACDDIVDPPTDATKVKDAVAGYQNTINGLSCNVDLSRRRRAEIVRAFTDNVQKVVVDRRGQESAEAARKRAGLAAIHVAIEHYRQRIAAVAPDYRALVLKFAQDQAAVGRKSREALARIVAGAAQPSLEKLDQLILQLVELQRAEAAHDADWLTRVGRLAGTFRTIEYEFTAGFSDYVELAGEAKIELPHLTEVPLQVLEGMKGTLEARERAFIGRVANLVQALRGREDAVVAAGLDAATRATRAAAARLRAEADFLAQVTNDANQPWNPTASSAPESSASFESTYLAARAFLRFEDLCGTTVPTGGSAWMASGCAVARLQTSRARTFMDGTLPRHIRNALPALRERVLPSRPDLIAALQEVESALGAADTLGAARAYDWLDQETRP